MATLFLVFWGTSILFSIVAAPTYIPTDSVGGFPFLVELVNFDTRKIHTLTQLYTDTLYINIDIWIYKEHTCKDFQNTVNSSCPCQMGLRELRERSLYISSPSSLCCLITLPWIVFYLCNFKSEHGGQHGLSSLKLPPSYVWGIPHLMRQSPSPHSRSWRCFPSFPCQDMWPQPQTWNLNLVPGRSREGGESALVKTGDGDGVAVPARDQGQHYFWEHQAPTGQAVLSVLSCSIWGVFLGLLDNVIWLSFQAAWSPRGLWLSRRVSELPTIG